MLSTRIISALIFLPFFYLIVWVLPPLYFTLFILAVAAVGLYEFYRMAGIRGVHPNRVLGIVLGVLLIVDAYYPLNFGIGAFSIAGYLIVIMIARLFSSRPVDGAFGDIAATFTGIFYVALLFAFQIMIRTGVDGKQWLVFLYFIIWASDIGAYAIGLPFGKHRLYEKISPKKSIEGLLGSLAAAVGMALLCRVWFLPSLGIQEAIGISLLLAIAGTIGDLAESLLKRSVGVKDSGGLIPGHGGVLDRMDSILFAGPVLYYYLALR
ncbi:MAG: phosphatidate cytidylyltransferase [Nitrospirota bacterium]